MTGIFSAPTAPSASTAAAINKTVTLPVLRYTIKVGLRIAEFFTHHTTAPENGVAHPIHE
jgi:hypothetical protein